MNTPAKSIWQSRRITTVVTVAMAAIILLAITVITMLDVSRQRTIFEQQLEEKGLALSRTLNDVLANPLYFRDMQGLRHLADVAKAQPEIESLTIFAPDGRVLIGPGDEKYPVGSVPDDVVERVVSQARTDIRFLEDHVELVTPVIVSHEVIGGLRFQFETSTLANEIRETVIQHIWQGAIVLLFGVLLSYLFAQSMVRRVREMIRVTDRIAAGDFDVAVDQSRFDEIGELARSLESMMGHLREAERQRAELQNEQLRKANQQLQDEVDERKRAQQISEETSANLKIALDELRATQEKMVQQERLSAVGQMTSGIAHDINNRLQIILGLSDTLLTDPDLELGGSDARDKLQLIRESSEDAAALVNLLRDFYRPQRSGQKFAAVDIAEVVSAAVQLTEPSWKDQAQSRGVDLSLETQVDDIPVIAGSPTELRDALVNLIFNAIDALPRGGEISIQARTEAGEAVIAVSDNGVGMPEDVRSRCLEPFFTTKGEGGSGLGLAMVYRTVLRHDGVVEIDSTAGSGATVQIRLPLNSRSVSKSANDSGETPTGPLDVLVVDDDTLVRELLAGLLARQEHKVVTAADGKDGLAKFGEQKFDVVILDRAMPDMNGDELALRLKSAAPWIPIIMLTGFGGLMNATEDAPDGVDLVLGKPIRHADLVEAMAKLVRDKAGENASTDQSARG